jgi:hypothetical protein
VNHCFEPLKPDQSTAGSARILRTATGSLPSAQSEQYSVSSIANAGCPIASPRKAAALAMPKPDEGRDASHHDLWRMLDLNG